MIGISRYRYIKTCFEINVCIIFNGHELHTTCQSAQTSLESENHCLLSLIYFCMFIPCKGTSTGQNWDCVSTARAGGLQIYPGQAYNYRHTVSLISASLHVHFSSSWLSEQKPWTPGQTETLLTHLSLPGATHVQAVSSGISLWL